MSADIRPGLGWLWYVRDGERIVAATTSWAAALAAARLLA